MGTAYDDMYNEMNQQDEPDLADLLARSVIARHLAKTDSKLITDEEILFVASEYIKNAPAPYPYVLVEGLAADIKAVIQRLGIYQLE